MLEAFSLNSETGQDCSITSLRDVSQHNEARNRSKYNKILLIFHMKQNPKESIERERECTRIPILVVKIFSSN